jgi:3-oxoacyl-[acyl-carrier protein] reductase
LNLKGKRALVTGGSRGIGRAIIEEFAKYGVNVVFTYQSSEKTANELSEKLSNEEVKVFSFKANASVYKDAEDSVNFCIEKLGGLDILVNNVGITKDNLLMRMTEEDFDSVIDANLKSVFNYTKAAIKPFISQKKGKIINISSVVGIIGNPGQSNYVASKAGVIGFTKSIAKELASRNITCNAIAPGFIKTDMTEKLNEKQIEAIMSNVPLKRMGEPKDVANAVLFLASDLSDYITGQVLVVDGGLAM